MDEIKGRPAIIIFAGIIFGILVGEKLCGYKHFALICLFFILIFTYFKNRLINFLHNDRTEPDKTLCNAFLLFGFALISGYLLIQPLASPILAEDHIYYYADLKQKQTIIGLVSSAPSYKKERYKFEVSVNFIKKNNKQIPASGKINVSWINEKGEKISRGDLIEFNGNVRSIRNFYNPGGFDYERFLSFKKVYASSFVYKDKLKIIKKKAEKSKYSISKVRENFCELIEKLPYKEEKKVLKALLTGKKDEIPEEIREAFNNSGTSHILAISGLHIGIAVFIFFFIFTKLFSLFKGFTEKGTVKKLAAFFTVIVALIYGFFAGMSPSTQRAVIMIAVFLYSFIFEEDPDTLNSLAVSGIIILIIDPASIFSISFILSFSAVFAISYGLKKTGVKKNKIFIFFLVSVFATIGTLPIILYNFNTLCLIGPFTNFIIIPIIGFITVPIGLASAFIYPLNLELSFFLLKISALVLSWAIEFIKIVSSIPYVSVKTITPNIIEILSFYGIAISLFNIKKSNFAKNTALFAALILCADSAYWVKERFLSQELRITVIDVGQGNSALIEFPKGACMLIDGGGFSDKSDFDSGKSIVAPFLRKKKIRTIDTIVLTHPDTDHVNGLTYIAENFFVKNLWSNNEAKDTKGYKSFLNAVRNNNNIKNINFQKLYGGHTLNGVKLDILYPVANFAELKKKQLWRDTNNNSLVLKVKYGDFSFLFTGDIRKKAEKELVKTAGSKLKTQVMLAPHHGSKTSSSDILLDAASPLVVVISAGFNNRYGFPHAPVINNYKKRGCKILRTDINGAVEIKSFGKAFKYNAPNNLKRLF